MRVHHIAAIAALCVVQVSCGLAESRSADRIQNAVESHVGGEIDLASVIPSTWDRLYVFPPYSDTTRIRQSLGFEWSGAARSPVDVSDGINLLVFVREHRVVEAINLRRDKGDFADAFRERGYPRDSARFRVVRAGELVGGAPLYRLLPAK